MYNFKLFYKTKQTIKKARQARDRPAFPDSTSTALMPSDFTLPIYFSLLMSYYHAMLMLIQFSTALNITD